MVVSAMEDMRRKIEKLEQDKIAIFRRLNCSYEISNKMISWINKIEDVLKEFVDLQYHIYTMSQQSGDSERYEKLLKKLSGEQSVEQVKSESERRSEVYNSQEKTDSKPESESLLLCQKCMKPIYDDDKIIRIHDGWIKDTKNFNEVHIESELWYHTNCYYEERQPDATGKKLETMLIYGQLNEKGDYLDLQQCYIDLDNFKVVKKEDLKKLISCNKCSHAHLKNELYCKCCIIWQCERKYLGVEEHE